MPTPRLPGGPEAVFHGDVIIDNDCLDLDALCSGQIRRHLKVQHVAGIILHDVQNTLAAIDCFGRLEHLVRRRTGEYRAGTSGIQHSATDESSVHGFVAAPTSGNQRDLIFHGSVCTGDVIWIGVNLDQIAKSGPKAGNGFENDVLGRINEFFHVLGGRS